MSLWTADNSSSNKETTSTIKEEEEEEVPRTKTTTPSPRRLEQAIRVFVGDLEALEGALLRFEVALLELKEGVLKEGAPEHQNGQKTRLLSPSEVCQELGEERTVVYLQEYINRQHHLRSLGEENSSRER